MCGRHSVQHEADFAGPCTCLWSAIALQFEVSCSSVLSEDSLRHWPVWGDRRVGKAIPSSIHNPAADFDFACAGVFADIRGEADVLFSCGAHSLTVPLDPPAMGSQVLTATRVRDEPACCLGQLPPPGEDVQGHLRAVQLGRHVQQTPRVQFHLGEFFGEGPQRHRQVRFLDVVVEACFDVGQPAYKIAEQVSLEVPIKDAGPALLPSHPVRESKVGSMSSLAPQPCLQPIHTQSQHVPPAGVSTAQSSEYKVGSTSSLAHLPLLASNLSEVPGMQLGAPFISDRQTSPAPHGPPTEATRKVARGPLLRRPGNIALLRAEAVLEDHMSVKRIALSFRKKSFFISHVFNVT